MRKEGKKNNILLVNIKNESRRTARNVESSMPNGQKSFTVEKGIVCCAFLFSDLQGQIFDVFDIP